MKNITFEWWGVSFNHNNQLIQYKTYMLTRNTLYGLNMFNPDPSAINISDDEFKQITKKWEKL